MLVICISAYNSTDPENKELKTCHVLSLARITQKNSWESNFPIQYAGSTHWVGFNPNKQKNSITNNCDILTVKPALLAPLRYFKQAKKDSSLKEMQTDRQYYNFISSGKTTGTSVGLTFLLMHFLQDLQMNSTTKKVFAATGCLDDERSLEISPVEGILEKHEALINFLESAGPEKIYFLSKKKRRLFEKCKSIRSYPIEDAKELEERLQVIGTFSRQSSFAPEPITPSPYIANNFYEEYLERLIEEVNKQYKKNYIAIAPCL